MKRNVELSGPLYWLVKLSDFNTSVGDDILVYPWCGEVVYRNVQAGFNLGEELVWYGRERVG